MRDYAKMYDKEQLEKWYLEDHLTLEEIGGLLGISRQAVFNRINRCRIDKSTAERFKSNVAFVEMNTRQLGSVGVFPRCTFAV
jgi:predicted DNA-binding protein YlxM (UPF0122 family)